MSSDNGSNDNQDNQIPIYSIEPQKAQLVCAKCEKGYVEVLNLPFDVLNTASHSALIIEHREPIVCNYCGAKYCYAIDGNNTHLAVQLIPLKSKEDEKKRIVTPDEIRSGFKLM